MKERLHWIDIAKGIGAILVVVGHVILGYWHTGYYNDYLVYNFIHGFIYSFHMPLFMIISGYLLSLSHPKGTTKQRVLRILINYGIPYVIFSAIRVFSKMIMSEHVITELTFRDLLWIPVYPVEYMWFLYALMLMHLIQIPLTSHIHTQKIVRIIHLLLAITGYFIQPYIQTLLQGIRFSGSIFDWLLKNYCFFLIGLYFSETIRAITEKNCSYCWF